MQKVYNLLLVSLLTNSAFAVNGSIFRAKKDIHLEKNIDYKGFLNVIDLYQYYVKGEGHLIYEGEEFELIKDTKSSLTKRINARSFLICKRQMILKKRRCENSPNSSYHKTSKGGQFDLRYSTSNCQLVFNESTHFCKDITGAIEGYKKYFSRL